MVHGENRISVGYGLTYEAKLYRNGSQVTDNSGNALVREVSHGSTTASFSVSDIPQAQRSGSFRVRVRMCVAEITDSTGTLSSTPTCGGYYDAGGSFRPAPAPSGVTANLFSSGDVGVSWTAISSGVSHYQVGYRQTDDTDSAWQVVAGTFTGSTASVPNLTCGTERSYEFRVRARADTSGAYSGSWGLWSPPSSPPVVVSCADSLASAEADAPPTAADRGSLAPARLPPSQELEEVQYA